MKNNFHKSIHLSSFNTKKSKKKSKIVFPRIIYTNHRPYCHASTISTVRTTSTVLRARRQDTQLTKLPPPPHVPVSKSTSPSPPPHLFIQTIFAIATRGHRHPVLSAVTSPRRPSNFPRIHRGEPCDVARSVGPQGV